METGHLAHQHRRLAEPRDHDALEIGDDAAIALIGVRVFAASAEPANAAHDELGIALVDHIAADGRVRMRDRVHHRGHRDATILRA